MRAAGEGRVLARVVVRHARHLVVAEAVVRGVAVGPAKAVGAVQLELRRHLDDRRVDERRDLPRAENRGNEEALEDRAAVGHAQRAVIGHGAGGHVGARGARGVRGAAQHDMLDRVALHHAAGQVALQQAPRLRDDLVGLAVREMQAGVALEVEFVQAGAGGGRVRQVDGARRDRHAGVPALSDAKARELADQAIAAAVRRLGHHHAAELLRIARLADQDPCLVRRAGRRPGNEVLIDRVVEIVEVGAFGPAGLPAASRPVR